MGVSNFTGPRESKLTIPRARKMAKHSKIPRIVNEIPGNLRANSQEKAVKLERKVVTHDSKSDLPLVFLLSYDFSKNKLSWKFFKEMPKKKIR